MKRTALILAALAATFAADGEPVRTATEGFVTNKIAEAVAAIPAPDFSTSNAALVETIEATAPAPGDYASVSNAAMNAVQPTNMPRLARYPMSQWGEDIYIAGDEYIDVFAEYHGALAHRIFDGWSLSLSSAFWDQFSDVAFSGSYNDLADTPTIPTVPTNVSAFNNDAGYLTGYTETDPTVPAWAKTQTKPTYTASEVGATTPADVTAAIREQSLGGIWDETLQVWWTPRMRNGSLTYEATTNVNLNAEN